MWLDVLVNSKQLTNSLKIVCRNEKKGIKINNSLFVTWIFSKTKALLWEQLKVHSDSLFADNGKFKSQDIETKIVLHLIKTRKLFKRLLIINKYAPKHVGENLHFFLFLLKIKILQCL